MTTTTPILRATEGAKKLRRFLERNGITRRAAGLAVGATNPTVCDWVGGKKRPRESKRVDIEAWTGGEVPASSWLTKDERKVRTVAPFRAPATDRGAA